MTIIKTQNGSVEGRFDNGLHVFKGIPYAEALDHKTRWLPPQPKKDWSGVRDAGAYGSIAHQFSNRGPELKWLAARTKYFRAIDVISSSPGEGNDCLLLNVWTPSVDSNAKLPVMVYIHGGGFLNGAATEIYNAAHIAEQGIVVVVLQYRLGPLGFLHGSGLFAGGYCSDNRAFLDQLCALRWVQDNIAAFGGDGGNVTIFGESAGAFSVYQLAASPQGRGLFNRAIAMGGMPDTYAPAKDYHQLSADVLADAGIHKGDLGALFHATPEQLRKIQGGVWKRLFTKKEDPRYGVLGRKRIPFMGAASETEFLPRDTMQVLSEGTPNNIDMMLGACRHDGRLFSLALPLPKKISAYLFAQYLSGIVPGNNVGKTARLYCGLPKRKDASIYERVNNDAFFKIPTIRAAMAHASGHPGRTYHYQVDHTSSVPGLGAIHGIDVALLFRAGTAKTLLDEEASTLEVSRAMIEAWASFAKTGKPTATLMPSWAPYEAKTRQTMVFDTPLRVEPDESISVRQIWGLA